MRLLIQVIVCTSLFVMSSCDEETFYDGDHFFINNAVSFALPAIRVPELPVA